jgi:site-specific recombinase XerD
MGPPLHADQAGVVRHVVDDRLVVAGALVENRTARAYGSAIRAYAAAIGDLGAATPASVALWAYAPGPSGRTPAAATVIVRLAALRGLYRYAGRVEVWTGPNPADDVDRPRRAQPLPKGLDAAGLRRLLSAVPPTTSGLRDRAIIIVIALAGLRRAEVLGCASATSPPTGMS